MPAHADIITGSVCGFQKVRGMRRIGGTDGCWIDDRFQCRIRLAFEEIDRRKCPAGVERSCERESGSRRAFQRRLMMNRKTGVIVAISLLLGLGIGYFAAHFFWKQFQPSRSAFVVNQLDSAALLKECKPKDSQFVIDPLGSSEENRYGFHGSWSASWSDNKDSVDVVGILEKKLQEFIESRGCQFSNGGFWGAVSGPGFQEWRRQYDYHQPDWSIGGTIFVLVHHEIGHQWSVVISFYAAYNPSR
jgi:hypothetical protein